MDIEHHLGQETKVFPKDSYSLLKIDMLVDSTIDHELLSFMDSFLSYH